MRIVLMLSALLLSWGAFADGKITGKITDEKTGEPIIGATVSIKGAGKGTATNIDGNFMLPVAAGTHIVVVNYVGFQSKEVEGVHVTERATVNINVAIRESGSTQLDEVVVHSSLKKENVNALYILQKNAATISDGISADIIKKSPDRSTGEVLKRVSGTTIQDNKFVVVRGLSDRYNVAMTDNSVLPSTEPNRKAFSFDIIPAAMIDNIVITKAATPDLPGDFAGGVINILTKETPDDNFNTISIGGMYNTISTGKDFRSGYRSSTDFLGFDDGARQLPGSFPASKVVERGVTQPQSNSALSLLNNDFAVRTHKAFPGVSLQGALGRVYHAGNGNKFGFTGALTYSHNELIKNNLIRQYDGFDYDDNVYTYSSNLGALFNAGYYFGGSKIVFKSLYNRIFDDNFLYREGYNNSSSSDIRYYAFDLVQKSLLKTSVEGEHKIGRGQSRLGWLLSYNNIINNRPDQRKVSYSKFGANDFLADNTTLGKANNRLFGDLNENIMTGNVNYSLPFNLFHQKSNLKIGAFEQYRHRDFSNRYIGSVLNIYTPDEENIRARPVETLFSDDLIQKGAYRLDEITIPGDEYKTTATTTAGFAMLDNKFSEKIRLVWGTRFESYNLSLQTGDGGVKINPVWNDLLPSANFTYSLTGKSNLRASYFRSVARPELREVAPLSYYDYELNATVQGNTALTRSRIDNMDIRYELYPGAGEILSVSVFYKHFDNTIENNVNGQNSGYEINPMNYSNARNVGVELEIRKTLGFIRKNSFFEHMNFYANFAYINSMVLLDSTNYANGHAYTSRPLSGQSPYVINTSLGYTLPDNKLSFNVLYNRIGQRIFLVGQGRFGHVYENARNLLDLQASYHISAHSELRFTVKDMLNNPVRLYFDQDNNGRFDRQDVTSGTIDSGKDWIYGEYRPGTTFMIMYNYRF